MRVRVRIGGRAIATEGLQTAVGDDSRIPLETEPGQTEQIEPTVPLSCSK